MTPEQFVKENLPDFEGRVQQHLNSDDSYYQYEEWDESFPYTKEKWECYQEMEKQDEINSFAYRNFDEALTNYTNKIKNEKNVVK